MAEKEIPGIRPYNAPAGGWGALKATAKAVQEQMSAPEAVVTLFRTNKPYAERSKAPEGFDCPGCAWPDKEHTSTFQFCENGAKAVTWEATKKRVPPEFFAANTVGSLLTWSDYQLEDQGRLTHPMVYNAEKDIYEAIEWDDAFAQIGAILRNTAPDAMEFYTSGRASNEAAFLYQIFARELGSNNFPDCSNMCHEATSVGLPMAIGIGKGTVSLEDFDHADLLLSIGHNPGTNHPRMMGTLHEMSRRGCPIIVFNPLRERALERFADPQDALEMATFGATEIASTYLQPKVGGDAAALKGIMKALLEMDAALGPAAKVIDRDFIAEHTVGFDAVAADLKALSWQEIEAVSGLPEQSLRKVAETYAKSNATIVTYGMGITQHHTGTQNVHQVVNLLLMRGNFGKPGAGICPLRGHSNVQGNRTVGITEKPSADVLQRIEQTFGFKPPSHHGHDAVAGMQAIAEGKSTALICLGGNLAVALSDPQACFAAMKKLDLSVHIATKLNRSHLLTGKHTFLLPCLGRTERDIQETGPQAVTVEDSMSMVHASRGKLKPASEFLKSEPAIVAGIAAATLPDSKVKWLHLIEDYDRIRDMIEAVYPDFVDYNDRIKTPGGFRLPLPPTERIWNTPSGKAEFLRMDGVMEDPVYADPNVLKLTTLRSHDQYNTTIYGLDDRYRGVFGRRDVVFINAQDLSDLGIEEGDQIVVETAFGDGKERRLDKVIAVTYEIARGSVGTYYPEGNCLVPLDYVDPVSGTPSYKSVPVRITRAAA
ncbi:FdhF/YdeP family oxidoreductase [Solilutibacter silvestris]|uniref:Fdhalpha-like: oxidoreductase alpha (Molybdopterin) subunit n=1 Tax=Solilutibacter silvestris TaxID=1645665 RepID=A0A2K1Q375_9GAMM|nr:FdhF/YdeP family oxidoreductase [Lysobacter silvestris]PNS09473.1 Fdhalpha-like: oxidoreductase alpha (molybdopterin) subunit [Lysobacter silvestris]